MKSDFVIDQPAIEEIIKNLTEKLKAYYVFSDIAGEICAHLEKHLQDGIYDDITEGKFLALALTTPMQEISQDKHLWVRWYPEPMPDHEGSLLKNREKVEELKRKARLNNFGIHKVERLPGNVGYIDMRNFFRTS